MKKITFILSICLLLALSSCNLRTPKAEIKISGEVITNEYKDLKGISLKVRDIYLKNDDNKKAIINVFPATSKLITITAQSTLFNYINITSDNNKIGISGGKFEKYVTNDVIINVYGYDLNVYDFDNVEANIDVKCSNTSLKINLLNMGSVFLSGDNEFDNVTFSLSGASQVNVTSLKSENVELELSGSSSCIISGIGVEQMKINLSGSSRAELVGNTKTLNTTLSGDSKLLDHFFNANKAYIKASGSSYIELTVVDELDVSLSGSSKMYYSGTPIIKNQQLSGDSKLIKNR